MELIDQLNWRYATKKFDSSKKLSQNQLDAILESIRLSPSSYGLQAYKAVVVENPTIRERLKQASWGQTQLTDASALIVFCRYADLQTQHVTTFIEKVAKTRGMTHEQLANYEKVILGTVQQFDVATKANWTAKQCYIALGVLLTACASLHIDACPMEGFDAKQYDEILGLGDKNLASVVVACVGFRAQDDSYQHAKKVRQCAEELFIRI